MSRFTLDVASPAQIVAAFAAAEKEGGHAWARSVLDWLHAMPFEERTERLRQLTAALTAHPQADRLIARIRAMGYRSSAIRVFAEKGLPKETAWLREAGGRIADRFLPRIAPADDLFMALEVLDVEEPDALWIESLPDDLIAAWSAIFAPRQEAFLAAARVVAIRCASLGLHRDIQDLQPGESVTVSPFYELPERIANGACPEWESFLARARDHLQRSHDALEVRGVTTNLVFRLDLVETLLQRLDTLLRLSAGSGDGRAFLAQIVRGYAEQRSLTSLVSAGGRRLAKKVVEHTGRAGEHYIAADAAEWRRQGLSGLGAGAITAFTALVKYAIPHWPLPPMEKGLAFALNYQISFIAMQIFHLSLASKMPAMTAAALADALEKNDGPEQEISLIASITRTQTIVTLANLAATMPLAAAIDLLIQWKFGTPYLSLAEAEHGVHSMHVWKSWTVLFAATTGASLWLASLAAGWTGNWMAFRELPRAVGESRRIRAIFGARGAGRLSRFVNDHLGGIAGYIVLGLLLGFLPVLAAFAGIPLEVRHVTLQAAALAYDYSALAAYKAWHWGDAGWGFAGLIATGVVNVGTSFALGLWLAIRSRGVDTKARRELWRELRRAFRSRPAQFFVPR